MTPRPNANDAINFAETMRYAALKRGRTNDAKRN